MAETVFHTIREQMDESLSYKALAYLASTSKAIFNSYSPLISTSFLSSFDFSYFLSLILFKYLTGLFVCLKMLTVCTSYISNPPKSSELATLIYHPQLSKSLFNPVCLSIHYFIIHHASQCILN